MFDLSKLKITPAGLGNCPACTYLNNDNAALCYSCAVKTMDALAPPDERCGICDRPYPYGQNHCSNIVCQMPDAKRGFVWNYSIAMKSGIIESGLIAYKYRDRSGWRLIFSRLLVGFLEEHRKLFDDFDLIVPSPTYVGPEEGARSSDHIAPIIETAAKLSNEWPFHVMPPVILRTKHVPSMMSTTSFGERIHNAENELRAALQVPELSMVRGKQIVVFDDTFTTGLTMREVALALKRAGATRVCGITLMRQPWK